MESCINNSQFLEQPDFHNVFFVSCLVLVANCFLADIFQYPELPSYTTFSFPLKKLFVCKRSCGGLCIQYKTRENCMFLQ